MGQLIATLPFTASMCLQVFVVLNGAQRTIRRYLMAFSAVSLYGKSAPGREPHVYLSCYLTMACYRKPHFKYLGLSRKILHPVFSYAAEEGAAFVVADLHSTNLASMFAILCAAHIYLYVVFVHRRGGDSLCG